MAIRKLDPHRGTTALAASPPPVSTPRPRREAVEPPRPQKVALAPNLPAPTPLRTAGIEGVTEAPPYGWYEGTHHAEGERTPRDAQYLTRKLVRVPKRADFAAEGLAHLERSGARPIYAREVVIHRPDGTTARINLMKAKHDSVPVDDFYLALEEILRTEVFTLDEAHAKALGVAAGTLSGAVVLQAIDQTIAEAVRLSEKVPPEAAPIPNESAGMRETFLKMLKRFAIQAVFHSRDLTTVHVAMGHDPSREKQLDETLRHDLVEPAPLKDLVWQLERRPHDAWMDHWLLTEVRAQAPQLVADLPAGGELSQAQVQSLYRRVKDDDALTFNCSALNPHNLVAMFRWGDSREDCNVLMDPHRLSPHHNGSSQSDVDFQQRAINFLSHHMPREHMGVRHEQRGEWDAIGPTGAVVPFGKLELAFQTDDAIRSSTVLQRIARDGARFFRAAEDRGYTVPWQKLRVPNTVEFVQLDHAYQTLQANNRVADDRYAESRSGAEAALKRASVPLSMRARTLLDELAKLDSGAGKERLGALSAIAVEVMTRAVTPADRELAAALAQTAVARFTQLSPASVETIDRFVPEAEAIEDALYRFEPKLAPRDGRLFVGAETARLLRERLDLLPRAAEEARAGQDSSTAQVYENWDALVKGGFQSIAH